MKNNNPCQLEFVAVATGLLRRKQVRWLSRLGKLRLNGRPARPDSKLNTGDELTIRNHKYRVIPGGNGRFGLTKVEALPERISAPIRVHCGYHKCLTLYSRKVYRRACRRLSFSPEVFRKYPTGFQHFLHRQDAWYDNCERFRISSVSGHCLDLDRFEDIRVIRFIRDPRDLIVSGYFYHKRAAESWCRFVDPIDVDYDMVNGVVPGALKKGQSLTDYLNQVSLEEGLAAEIDFRKNHFQSMMQWPQDDPRVRVFRYEDILGNETATFREVFSFLKQPGWIIKKAEEDAHRYRAGAREAKKGHVRNPTSQQWRELFTPELNKRFVDTYAPLLERYHYPME